MDEKMICPICGEMTSSYMGHYRKDKLCKNHAAEFKNGKLIQCAKCGEKGVQPGSFVRNNKRTQSGIKKGRSPSGLAATPFFRAAFRFALRVHFFPFCLLAMAGA